ncbi:chaplin [Streptomyces sp. WAC 06738]|uniref:chaplin n=1 Tax=Streptomyces sp. WAC 06738 TaxID=2203210 RepID=UPI0019D2DD4E|nr:chaplin [Streptomyces sp. WAC 06738]
MRHVARKGLFTIAAAGGMLVAAGATAAQADAGAEGAATNSPGVGSGNTVQAPVNVPVNVCGNTVNAGGLLNPAFGNTCVNDGGGTKTGGHATGGGAQAQGQSSQSPGVLSGNTVQVPVDVPVNACGNSANVVGVGNPAFGNKCGNGAVPDTPKPPKPEEPTTPEEPDRPDVPDTPEQPDTPDRPDEPKDRSHTPPNHETQAGAPAPETEQLAETGSEIPVGALIPLSGGLLLGGAVLYRRARAAAA